MLGSHSPESGWLVYWLLRAACFLARSAWWDGWSTARRMMSDRLMIDWWWCLLWAEGARDREFSCCTRRGFFHCFFSFEEFEVGWRGSRIIIITPRRGDQGAGGARRRRFGVRSACTYLDSLVYAAASAIIRSFTTPQVGAGELSRTSNVYMYVQ